jgi:argininosuccinate lyase
LVSALLEQAEKAGEQVMPAYTHLQRAEPVLVAHWLLAYVEMFFRDVERLADCRRRTNVSPLGSGAIAGATLALDRQQMAVELGFDGPSANSMDATSDRDFAVEFVQALALTAGHLSRFAEEMTLFATQEFGFVRLPESYSTGSSAMPQKQNPDAMELLRGKAGRICGSAVSLLVSTKGLPLAYNNDLQERQEPVFEAAEQSLAMLRTAAGFVRALSFDFERMRQATQGGFMNAMAAATYLTKKGTPFRRAHEQIAGAVRLCLEKGCGLEELSLDELRQHCPDADEDFYQAIRLEAVLACHAVPGGTDPAFVRKALAQAQARVEELKGALHAHA